MRRSSLRTWLLVVSVLFALFTVGTIAIATYVVVRDGLSSATNDAMRHLADIAPGLMERESADAVAAVEAAGLTGTEFDRAADEEFIRQLDERLKVRGVSQSEYALYDNNLKRLWATSEDGIPPSDGTAREQALTRNLVTYSSVARGGRLGGLFSRARLDVEMAHLPVEMPSGSPAVLTIAYKPRPEELVMDSIRGPMTALSIAAVLVMIVVMQVWMTWVLRLIDELRRAADSIDAGKLDVRLPERSSNEIGDLARSINRLIDRLRRRADAQTRFVADASHELSTPVAGIRGYINILRAWGADDAEVREEAVDAIDRESRRMARLTGNLLTLVRSEQALELRAVRFDVNMCCREVLAVAATRYSNKNQRFVGPEEGPLIMIGDPDRTEDVISILVDNAAKYTPDHGRISVLARRRRDQVAIEVSDTGPGIPATDLPNVFERFYRSDASRSRGTGGFGLGLAIAKSLTEELGGTIEVESEVGRGTTFTVRLPRGRV